MQETKVPAGQPTPANGYASPEALAGAGLRLVTKHEAADMLAMSHETLKKLRLRPDSPLIRNVHYFKLNSRTIRYNAPLLMDWAINRDNPAVHQRTIEQFLAATPANQPKKRGRKPARSCCVWVFILCLSIKHASKRFIFHNSILPLANHASAFYSAIPDA